MLVTFNAEVPDHSVPDHIVEQVLIVEGDHTPIHILGYKNSDPNEVLRAKGNVLDHRVG